MFFHRLYRLQPLQEANAQLKAAKSEADEERNRLRLMFERQKELISCLGKNLPKTITMTDGYDGSISGSVARGGCQ